MKNLQKMGGVSALYAGLAYVVGMVGFILIIGTGGDLDPVQKVALLLDNQVSLHILYIIVYQAWSIFLVILTLAIYERLKGDAPVIMQIVLAIGVMWGTVVIASGMIYNIGMDTVVNLYGTDQAQAATVWLTISSVCDGIGGGNEGLGGLWMFLTSWVALRTGKFPKALNYLGLVIGVAGIISAAPGLAEIGLIFGITQIVWFVWLGIIMLRSSSSAAA